MSCYKGWKFAKRKENSTFYIDMSSIKLRFLTKLMYMHNFNLRISINYGLQLGKKIEEKINSHVVCNSMNTLHFSLQAV